MIYIKWLLILSILLSFATVAIASDEPNSSIVGVITEVKDDKITFSTALAEGSVDPECVDIVMPEDVPGARICLLAGDTVEIFYAGELNDNFCVVKLNYITPMATGVYKILTLAMEDGHVIMTIAIDGVDQDFIMDDAWVYAKDNELHPGDTVNVVYAGELSDKPYALTISEISEE